MTIAYVVAALCVAALGLIYGFWAFILGILVLLATIMAKEIEKESEE